MDRPQSLADFLGIAHPGEPPATTSNFPPKLTAKQFSQAVLNSPEFRRYVLAGLVACDLPPQVVLRLMDHGWGKVADKLEVEDVGNIKHMNLEQLEQHAAFLAKVARRLRERKETDPSQSIH